MHAVYALCRLADDIVDADGATGADHVAADDAALGDFRDRFLDARRDGHAATTPSWPRWRDSVVETGIDPELLRPVLRRDGPGPRHHPYDTWDDLLGYMDGSAAVIGEMMLPVLRPTSPAALEPARSLGLAFQLTNFLRDVDEDLDRGRVYVPQEDLERFGADPTARRVTPGRGAT